MKQQKYKKGSALRSRHKRNFLKSASLSQAAILLIAVSVVVSIGVYILIHFQYKEHFLPNTIINHVDCSNLTAAEAHSKLQNSLDSYALNISFRDGRNFVIHPEDVDYHYQDAQELENLVAKQNSWKWPIAVFSTSEFPINLHPYINETKLRDILNAQPNLQASAMKAPVSATAVYDNGTFRIQPEDQGSTLDFQTFCNAVEEALKSAAPSLDADQAGLYAKPAVTSDDPALVRSLDSLNELAAASITYEKPDGTTSVLDGTTIKEWLKRNSDGTYEKDEAYFNEKITEFVAALGTELDTKGDPLTFPTHYGGTYTLISTLFGWEVDEPAEIQQLQEEIQNHAVVTREPVYCSRGVTSDANGGLGDTYAEVDLSAQQMWYYEDGVCVLSSAIVSGTMIPSRYTPEGIFTMGTKESPSVLRGEIDPKTNKPAYITDVTYWMPFYGGIGFHDADWNYTNGNGGFGGSCYLYNGSHGCINLPSDVAGSLYSRIQEGTPVVCYYPDGYELREEPKTETEDSDSTIDDNTANYNTSGDAWNYGTADYGYGYYGTTDYDSAGYGTTDYGSAGYGTTDYGSAGYGTTDYGSADYGTTDYGSAGYGTTDYSSAGYGTTDYGTTGYGSVGYGTTN